MTALFATTQGVLAERRRRFLLAWAQWVEEGASSRSRPLRIFFEAELGFEAWVLERTGSRRRRRAVRRPARPLVTSAPALPARGLVPALPALPALSALSKVEQARFAERVAVVALVTAALGVASAASVTAAGRTLAVDQLATGVPAPVEALAAGPGLGEGNEAASLKGAAPDRVSSPPVVVSEPLQARPVPERTIPAQRGALPVGKGMWIWLSDHAEAGDVGAIVARARAVGLTHLYVRTASLRQGFYAGPFLDQLLPAAHAANIRVYAWDFPYLKDVQGDVARAVQAISHLTPDGHRVDGYVADIELRSMGVNITPGTALAFGAGLRKAVGPNYPLIACVPRPSSQLVHYPFAEVVASFDAIAPMVYWLGQEPGAHVTGAVRALSVFGKPVLPVGQAYDGLAEGGPAGVPPRKEIIRFMQAGDEVGATAVSWWSWQHADQEAWDAVRDAAEFRLPSGDPSTFTPGQTRAYQTLLSSLGFPAPVTGAWDGTTTAAVQAYQQAARLPITGVIDDETRALLLTPFAPPIQPQP